MNLSDQPMDAQGLDQLKKQSEEWNPQQWHQNIGRVPIEAIAPLFSGLEDPAKLFEALSGLANQKALEFAGKALSFSQFSNILNHSKVNNLLEKLPPLFVGMSTDIFRAIIEQIDQKQMEILKKEVFTEPLQHQLTILSQTLMHDVSQFGNEISIKETELNELSLTDITQAEILAVKKRIELLHQSGINLLNIISKVLALAWQTYRTDLIEQLSHAKELCQKNIIMRVGIVENGKPLNGLWTLLENRLNSVFEHSNGTIKKDTPIMEALANFSVWYLRDYWEIGLLPEVANEESLELSSQTHSEKECLQHSEKLLLAAQNRLEKMGFSVLDDLKKACIYSRKALQEYINLKNS